MEKLAEIEREVPSLETCRRLREVGLPQNGGIWYWVFHREYIGDWLVAYGVAPYSWTDLWIFVPLRIKGEPATWWEVPTLSNDKGIYRAPTSRELGEMMPVGVHTYRSEEGFICEWGEKGYSVVAETEAEARARMLIQLIIDGYVKMPERKE